MKGKEQGETRILRRAVMNVSPKQSLWFAWSPNPIPGPEGEGESSRPQFDAVEDGASQVQLTVLDTSKRWRHHPSADRESGPNGLDGSQGIPDDARDLENQQYKSSNLNSDGIILSQPIHLNKLVAIFEINNSAPTPNEPSSILEVGAAATLDLPLDATKIFLGFHDGRHWTNNEGEDMQVQIDWL
ncbi:MAG: hypothetical protein RIC55_00770 [Pirellulaceae bacterium]